MLKKEEKEMMTSSASSVTSSSSISAASAFTSSSSSTSSASPSSPCAACKFLRRKCHPDCVFAPYFPPDNPQKFAHVHKVFGASNVTKLLNELSPYQREDAVNSLAYEADMRLRDPVYGCVGVISILQHQLRQLQIDLERAKSELSKYQTAAAGVGGGNGVVHFNPMAAGVDFFGLGRNNYEAEMGGRFGINNGGGDVGGTVTVGGSFGLQFQKPPTRSAGVDERQVFRPSLN